MARYSNGIHGSFSGLVGTVVGVTRNGITYMRSRPKKRTSPATERELINRQKFADSQAWLQPLKGLVRECFKGYSARAEGFVAAKSYLLKHAFEGAGNNLVINPALVKLSYGDLPLPGNLTAEHKGNGVIQFSWEITGSSLERLTDQVIMVAYDIKGGQAMWKLHGQLLRNGSDVLELPGFKGALHLYVAFESADRSRRSESMYLGVIDV